MKTKRTRRMSPARRHTSLTQLTAVNQLGVGLSECEVAEITTGSGVPLHPDVDPHCDQLSAGHIRKLASDLAIEERGKLG